MTQELDTSIKRIKVEVQTKDGYEEEYREVDLENHFLIDENQLEKHMCEQGLLLVYYGEIFSLLKAELSRKEEKVKSTYAIIASVVRSRAAHEGIKMTEGKVNELVLIEDRYQEALRELDDARYRYYHGETWWRSIQQKSDLLYALAYRQSAEIKKGT